MSVALNFRRWGMAVATLVAVLGLAAACPDPGEPGSGGGWTPGGGGGGITSIR